MGMIRMSGIPHAPVEEVVEVVTPKAKNIGAGRKTGPTKPKPKKAGK